MENSIQKFPIYLWAEVLNLLFFITIYATSMDIFHVCYASFTFMQYLAHYSRSTHTHKHILACRMKASNIKSSKNFGKDLNGGTTLPNHRQGTSKTFEKSYNYEKVQKVLADARSFSAFFFFGFDCTSQR